MEPKIIGLNSRWINRIIFLLSLVGIVMALYVTQSFLRGSPIVCVNSGCELVRKSAASYIFGIPVPAFGLVGYTFIAVLAFLRTSSTSPTLGKILAAVAGGGVLFVSWFTWTELFVIRGVCTWCAISALNMTIIFVLALMSLKIKQINHG